MKKRRPSYLPQGFETLEQAKHRYRVRDNLFVENGLEPLGLLNEANPVDKRKLRRGLLSEAYRLGFHKKLWFSASIVPKGLLIPEGELKFNDLIIIKERIAKILERSGLKGALIIGGLDISGNSADNVFQGYQIHVYLLIYGFPKEVVRPELQKAFGSHEEAYRPVVTKAVNPDDFFEVLSYSVKGEFYHRSSYLRPVEGDDVRFEKRTWQQALKPKHQLELYSWLAQYDIGARLILRNVKRIRTANRSRVRLQLLAPYDELFPRLSSGSATRKAKDGTGAPRRAIKRPRSAIQ
nr:hypothetical protein [uncultured Cohaesibacter sp.]